jgi:NADPH:quinone reductase-like Zn-dependent oxidoreductase
MSTSDSEHTLEVVRADLHDTRVVERPVPAPREGEALLRVERFGLTANNITYAVLGDMLRYWEFFPAEEGWGRIPMWGFAAVVASSADGVEPGLRVFGYLPMSTHLVVTPDRVGEAGFVDAAEHRSALPPAYNAYRAVGADPVYDPEREDEQMLLLPLYYLSFLLDDFLEEHEMFGAPTVVVSSASSKAALGTAFLLAGREVDVVGLTSPGKVEAVESAGVYDRVVSYEAVDALPEADAVYLDFTGDAGVREAVHRRLGDRLRHSAAVGVTHWDDGAGDADGAPLPGPAPTPFFAPDRIRTRVKEWGQAGLDARFAESWRRLVAWSDGWLEITRGAGPEAVEAAYREVLDGKTAGSTGHSLTMWAGRADALRTD